MLTANWTAKLEYLYVDLRGGVFNDVVPGFGVVPESIAFHANVRGRASITNSTGIGSS